MFLSHAASFWTHAECKPDPVNHSTYQTCPAYHDPLVVLNQMPAWSRGFCPLSPKPVITLPPYWNCEITKALSELMTSHLLTMWRHTDFRGSVCLFVINLVYTIELKLCMYGNVMTLTKHTPWEVLKIQAGA